MEENSRRLEDMSIIELKAICFDLDNDIKIKQSQLSQVYKVLQDKFREEKENIKSNNQTNKIITNKIEVKK